MKILVVEGIATSGKSTLIDSICSVLGREKVKVYGEIKTHVPIMEQSGDLHIDFFKSLIDDALKSDVDLVIFDRFHFTQAFRAKAQIGEYSKVEELLLENKTLVCYLQIDDTAIEERVRLATEHRDKEWGEYVKTKGKSFKEIANYYINQQDNQLNLLKRSKLECQIFNTTSHNFQEVAELIIADWY